MRNLKKALSLTLALALSLALAVPAFADGSGWNLSIRGKSVEEVTAPSADFKATFWYSGSGPDPQYEYYTKDEAVDSGMENVITLRAGDTIVLTVTNPGTVMIFGAWSDPEGDGIYEQRLFEASGNKESGTYTVLPATTASPVQTVYDDERGESKCSPRCYLTTDGRLGWSPDSAAAYEKYFETYEYGWTEITISADYLLEQFGPNTYMDIFAYLSQGLAEMQDWFVYLAGDSQPTTPATPSTPATKAVLSPQKLTVDGKDIECEKYNIDGSNYFKLRDLACLLSGTGSQFEVGYDEATSTVSITTGEAYTPAGTELEAGVDNSATAQPSSQTILINGEKHDGLTVYNIGGSNFFQLRELGSVLGFEVDYDVDTNTAIVCSVQK